MRPLWILALLFGLLGLIGVSFGFQGVANGSVRLRDIYAAEYTHTFNQEDLNHCNKTFSSSCGRVFCDFYCWFPVNTSAPGITPIKLAGNQQFGKGRFGRCHDFPLNIFMYWKKWTISGQSMLENMTRKKLAQCLRRFLNHTDTWTVIVESQKTLRS